MTEFELLAAKLKESHAPMIYGLGGISMEEQRLAVCLARKLGAMVSVERILIPTVTEAALSRCGLLLYAGGELPFKVDDGVKTVRDDRLLNADAWRMLCSLFRGNKLDGAEAFASLYEDINNSGSTAVILAADKVSEELRRTVSRFVCEGSRIGIMQIPSIPNALGAYEVMLEEAGGAAAWLGEKVQAGCEFAVENLPQGAYDLVLRVGRGQDISAGDVPHFAIAQEAYEGECLIKAVSHGGTVLRFDGVPQDMAAEKGEGDVLDLLTRLVKEVEA